MRLVLNFLLNDVENYVILQIIYSAEWIHDSRQCIGKNVGGNDHRLIEDIYRNVPETTLSNHQKPP